MSANFLRELKRRNIFKVATGYAISGWLVIQLVNNIFPVFEFPQWTTQFVIVLVFLGFPIALLLSWAYEITPKGIKKSDEVAPAESIAPQTARRLNFYIISALSVLVVSMVMERLFFAGTNSVEQSVVQSPASITPLIPTIHDKSIAVLPFDDFDAGGDEAYFADGLTEELLNSLARTSDLLVASRTASFKYKDQTVDIKEVSSALGVAHILEGSVRRSSTRLRITAQLIRTSDGFHLWSETYDRQPDDIIEVQEDIAFRIATALQTAMDPVALRQMLEAGTRSVEAYNAFLKGRSLESSTAASYEQFELARELDPMFATAHFHAANYWAIALAPTKIRLEARAESTPELLRLLQERLAMAVEHAKAPERYYYQSTQARANLQMEIAREFMRRFLREASTIRASFSTSGTNVSELRNDLLDKSLTMEMINVDTKSPIVDGELFGNIILSYFSAREFELGHSFALEAIKRFPDAEFLLYQAHRLFLWAGYREEARALVPRIIGTDLPERTIAIMRIREACADGNVAEANRIFDAEMNNFSSIMENGNIWLALHILNRVDEANALLQPLDTEGSLYSLSTFWVYPYFDIAQFPNLRKVLEDQNIELPTYQPVPFACQ